MAINIQESPWSGLDRSLDSLFRFIALEEGKDERAAAVDESLRRWTDAESDEDAAIALAAQNRKEDEARYDKEQQTKQEQYQAEQATLKKAALDKDFSDFINFIESDDTSPEQGLLTLNKIVGMKKFAPYIDKIRTRIKTKEDVIFDSGIIADITGLMEKGGTNDLSRARVLAKTIRGADRRTQAYTSIQTFEVSQVGLEGSQIAQAYQDPDLRLIIANQTLRDKKYALMIQNSQIPLSRPQQEALYTQIDNEFNNPDIRLQEFYAGMESPEEYPDFVPADALSQAWHNTIESAITAGSLPVNTVLTKEIFDEIISKNNLVRMPDGTLGIEMKPVEGVTKEITPAVKSVPSGELDLIYNFQTGKHYHSGTNRIATPEEISQWNQAQEIAEGRLNLGLWWKGAMRDAKTALKAGKVSSLREYLEKNTRWSDEKIEEAIRRKAEVNVRR